MSILQRVENDIRGVIGGNPAPAQGQPISGPIMPAMPQELGQYQPMARMIPEAKAMPAPVAAALVGAAQAAQPTVHVPSYMAGLHDGHAAAIGLYQPQGANPQFNNINPQMLGGGEGAVAANPQPITTQNNTPLYLQ